MAFNPQTRIPIRYRNDDVALTPGTYTNVTITVSADGKITAISSGAASATSTVSATTDFTGFITLTLSFVLTTGWNQWHMRAAWHDVNDNGGGYDIRGATQFQAGLIEIGGGGTSTNNAYGDAAASPMAVVAVAGDTLKFTFQSNATGTMSYVFSHINAFDL